MSVEPSRTTGEETITLYRPTWRHELALVRDSGYRAWPPRLPEQPIFYPVLSEEYATQIARDLERTRDIHRLCDALPRSGGISA